MPLLPSCHVDGFTRASLPPEAEWPVLEFTLPELRWPDRFNCVEWLLDRALTEIDPAKPAVMSRAGVWSYAQLAAEVNRYCHVLSHDLGVVAGNRILLRGANSAALYALWLATIKVGAVPVSTMPLLRSRELAEIVDKAQIRLALCEDALLEELVPQVGTTVLERIVGYGTQTSELERLTRTKPDRFTAVATSQDDVCLLAFTSGTTGRAKATMHFHRDVAAMCETFARHHAAGTPDSVFTGTPPLAFTFGLGGLLVFPLYFRAAAAIADSGTPAALGEAIQKYRVTHVFTSATAYKVLATRTGEFDLSTLRVCVSAGEALPRSVSDDWYAQTGLRLVDGLGGTEMIHIFISAAGAEVRPGATGKPVPGYTAEIFDESYRPIVGAGTGRLGVRGPTGCRYLSDARQREYVKNGWNMTGDVYRRDEDGYYWYVARTDDMIVSAGYNIAPLEIENALAEHPAVQECAVVGWPDDERGSIVKAFVVLRGEHVPSAELEKALQNHVKRTLAPYKYPRALAFVKALPRTPTGKLQRSALRQGAVKQ